MSEETQWVDLSLFQSLTESNIKVKEYKLDERQKVVIKLMFIDHFGASKMFKIESKWWHIFTITTPAII